jgi:5-hydroxyisourate hydrolase
MSGRLTTHVLDIVNGRPAGALRIELWRIEPGEEGEQRTRLRSQLTNEDGRTAEPMVSGDAMSAGIYELVFFVGQYFADLGAANAAIPFLDIVPIRFGISDTNAHYHVPLLASPWAYSTYRGS